VVAAEVTEVEEVIDMAEVEADTSVVGAEDTIEDTVVIDRHLHITGETITGVEVDLDHIHHVSLSRIIDGL